MASAASAVGLYQKVKPVPKSVDSAASAKIEVLQILLRHLFSMYILKQSHLNIEMELYCA